MNRTEAERALRMAAQDGIDLDGAEPPPGYERRRWREGQRARDRLAPPTERNVRLLPMTGSAAPAPARRTAPPAAQANAAGPSTATVPAYADQQGLTGKTLPERAMLHDPPDHDPDPAYDDRGTRAASVRNIAAADTAAASAPPWWASSISDADLDARTYPPLQMLVESTLTRAGLTLLAGPPKIGKSFLAYGLACAVAAGGRALGTLHAEQTDVLVVSLDDQSEARAQRRLRAVRGGQPAGGRLTLHLEPNLGTGAAAAASLSAYLHTHPSTGLLVIDTLEHLRPGAKAGQGAYSADVQFLGQMRQVLAEHPTVTMLALAHTRKGEDEGDPVAAVSGTHGVTGGADAALVLSGKRGAPRRVLDLVTRDGDDRKLVLRWTDAGLVTTDDDPDDPTVAMTRDDALVYRAVADYGSPVSAADLAVLASLRDMPKIGNRLARLAKDGFITRSQRGVYSAS